MTCATGSSRSTDSVAVGEGFGVLICLGVGLSSGDDVVAAVEELFAAVVAFAVRVGAMGVETDSGTNTSPLSPVPSPIMLASSAAVGFSSTWELSELLVSTFVAGVSVGISSIGC